MSEIVKEFPSKLGKRSGGKFDKLLDGQIHRVIPTAEYRMRVKSVEQGIRQRAVHKNIKVRVQNHKEMIGGKNMPVIYVQALIPVEVEAKA